MGEDSDLNTFLLVLFNRLFSPIVKYLYNWTLDLILLIKIFKPNSKCLKQFKIMRNYPIPCSTLSSSHSCSGAEEPALGLG